MRAVCAATHVITDKRVAVEWMLPAVSTNEVRCPRLASFARRRSRPASSTRTSADEDTLLLYRFSEDGSTIRDESPLANHAARPDSATHVAECRAP